MLIVYLEKLNLFGKSHSNARKHLVSWKIKVEAASWKSKQDVLNDYPNAKMIANNRARFEITHNTYRLIAQLYYEDQRVEIRFIGTHNEYEKIDPETV
jgi:mRNA interferase HigB